MTWDFHDFPGAFQVHVKQTIKNKKIVLECANSEGGNTQVVMNFEPLDKDSTLVRIEEYVGRIKYKSHLMNLIAIARDGCRCFVVLKFT